MQQDIEQSLKSDDAKIRDHCDKARDAMQMTMLQAQTKLDEIHKAFTDEIDQYESKCQKTFKSIQQNKANIELVLNKTNEFLLKSNQLDFKKAKVN